jgi:glycosyltransferase involved in cell wall biosynthesis
VTCKIALLRICLVHNSYGKFSGEEAVVHGLVELLRSNGHEVVELIRSSDELKTMFLGPVRAFFSGIYNPSSRKVMGRLLAEHHPDVVHVHNVFPLISPSVLPECRRAGVPVVMTVHNYRLVCPNGLHMPKGRYQICEKCSGGREYWCVLRNCEQSYLKSLGYALRGYIARRFGFFRKNVTIFACLTDFQRKRLMAEGYPEDRLHVLPNMAPAVADAGAELGRADGFAAYVGRISPEKGVDLLLAAAKSLSDIPFHLAGDCEAMPHLLQQADKNVSFLGPLDKGALSGFYRESRFLLLCSTWFEGFPVVLLEGMAHGRPVIAPRIGGIPEIVDDGVTGLLFEPGNAEDLADKVRYLWDRSDLCRQMGRAGRSKALREYSSGRYYERLLVLYYEAIASGPGNCGPISGQTPLAQT